MAQHAHLDDGLLFREGEMETSGKIIKSARFKVGMTQKRFAEVLGRAQSEVSKYERDLVDAPGSIVIHCMNMLGPENGVVLAPSVDNIIDKLRAGFSSPSHAMARSLIMGIILNEEQKNRTGENLV